MLKRFIFALLGVLLLSSADSCQSFGKKNTNPKKDVELAVICAADTDCTIVQKNCCSCKEGGQQLAMAKKQAVAWQSKLAADCRQTQCIKVISKDESCKKNSVKCVEGVCTLN